MLVRYRMNSSITIEQFKDDIHDIITGQIASVNDLSNGCDKANSQVLGAYPNGIYTAVDAESFTYSKEHHEFSDSTHYFRLGFNSEEMNSWTFSKDYDSESNVLVNSQALTDETLVHGIRGSITDGVLTVENFFPNSFWGPNTAISSGIEDGDRLVLTNTRGDTASLLPGTRIESQVSGTTGSTGTYRLNKIQSVPESGRQYSLLRESSDLSLQRLAYDVNTQPTGIDFVITDKLFFISSPASGINLGIVDLGKSGVSREFDDSMLMASFDLNANLLKIPFYYKFNTFSYGAKRDIDVVGELPIRQFRVDSSLALIENPAFMRQNENGNSVAIIYGLFLLPQSTLINNAIYQDSSNLARLVINNYAILTE